jgi:hypothetical protein
MYAQHEMHGLYNNNKKNYKKGRRGKRECPRQMPESG